MTVRPRGQAQCTVSFLTPSSPHVHPARVNTHRLSQQWALPVMKLVGMSTYTLHCRRIHVGQEGVARSLGLGRRSGD